MLSDFYSGDCFDRVVVPFDYRICVYDVQLELIVRDNLWSHQICVCVCMCVCLCVCVSLQKCIQCVNVYVLEFLSMYVYILSFFFVFSLISLLPLNNLPLLIYRKTQSTTNPPLWVFLFVWYMYIYIYVYIYMKTLNLTSIVQQRFFFFEYVAASKKNQPINDMASWLGLSNMPTTSLERGKISNQSVDQNNAV